MFTTAFWIAVFERTVKTFAQALVAAIGTDATGLLEVNWRAALSIAGLAAVLSVLTSIASAGAGGEGPSLGAETIRKV